jgi:hypothetical protein
VLKTSLITGKDIPKFDKDIVGNILLNTADESVTMQATSIALSARPNQTAT